MRVLCLIALATCALAAQAQPFQTSLGTHLTPSAQELEGVGFGRGEWVDADADGDYEVVVSGYSLASAGPVTTLYYEWGGYLDPVDVSLDPVQFGGVSWADIDGDGDLDAFVFGNGSDTRPVGHLWRNDGNVVFNWVETPVPGISGGGVDWGDMDNDGDLDLAVTGFSMEGPLTRIYRNDGNGGLTEVAAGLPGASFGQIKWGDIDNDFDQDLLLTGNAVHGPLAAVFLNDGAGGFVDSGIPLQGVTAGGGSFVDYDSDGDLDITVTGAATALGSITHLYRNNGGLRFTHLRYGFPGVSDGGTMWTDFDNDGRLEFLMYGRSSRSACEVAMFSFDMFGAHEIDLGIPGTYGGTVTPGDPDGDGDVDLLVTGNGCTQPVQATMYLSNVAETRPNQPPGAPAVLAAVRSAEGMRLLWTGALDHGESATPPDGLRYLLRVGTASGNSDVVRPALGPAGRLLTAQQPGIISTSGTLLRLGQGRYYWSVRAVDNGGMVSAESAEHTFEIDPVQSTNTESDALPSGFELDQNYPNPFNPSTRIEFSLPTSGWVQIGVFDLSGRLVEMLHQGRMEAGDHAVVFSAEGLPSGVYIYRMETPSGALTREMVLQK